MDNFLVARRNSQFQAMQAPLALLRREILRKTLLALRHISGNFAKFLIQVPTFFKAGNFARGPRMSPEEHEFT
jgi:hypothetical protein